MVIALEEVLRSKKRLELVIESIPETHFVKKVDEPLEQYTTPAHIVSDLIWNLHVSGKFRESIIVDLGCGTGRITIASSITFSSYSIGVDIDSILVENAVACSKKLRVDSKTDFIVADARFTPLRKSGRIIVVMNPPFGTRRRGADKEFLDSACMISDLIISLHLSSEKSRAFLARYMLSKGFNTRVLKTYMLEIKQSLPHHKSRVKRIPVDLIMYERRSMS